MGTDRGGSVRDKKLSWDQAGTAVSFAWHKIRRFKRPAAIPTDLSIGRRNGKIRLPQVLTERVPY